MLRQLNRRRVRKNYFRSLFATVPSLALFSTLFTKYRMTPTANSNNSSRNITLKLSRNEG